MLPEAAHKYDMNHGLDRKYTRVVCNLATFSKMQWSSRYQRDSMLPRILWVDKTKTLKELHYQVFEHFRHLLAEWVDWKDPTSDREAKEPGSAKDLRKNLIDFPYVPEGLNRAMTKKEFLGMTTEACFKLCMKGLLEDASSDKSNSFDLQRQPYQLFFKDISGYYESCSYCGNQRCGGCPVPLEEVQISTVIEKLGLETNNTLYSSDRMRRGKELQI